MGEEEKEGEGAAADKINDMIENIKRSYDIAIQKWGVGDSVAQEKGLRIRDPASRPEPPPSTPADPSSGSPCNQAWQPTRYRH